MANYLSRRDAAHELMAQVGDQLIVCGLGSPVSDVSREKERDLNFYLVGAMGSAVPLGLGLALAQPERSVVVVTGDVHFKPKAKIAVTGKPDNVTK